MQWENRHVARLQAGARALRLGELDAATVLRALRELANAAFAGGDGIVRLQASRTDDGSIHLVGTVRGLGIDRPEWSARLVSLTHQGASFSDGPKTTSRLTLALAADDARAAGVDEAVLLDGSGLVVEGASSNLFVALSGGSLCTPRVASGAVAGIARTLVLERIEEAEERDISKGELLDASELIAVNAVRGARPITRLDGKPVGDGRPGPWSRRLAAALTGD